MRALAERLLALSDRRIRPIVPEFSDREMDVLERLLGQQDKQIARAMDRTVPGVRYHMKKIFRKLGVGSRREAVECARRMGLLAGR